MQQYSLLEEIAPNPQEHMLGLQYIADFITPENQITLLHHIDSQPWNTDLKRRVQHYGYHYDFKKRHFMPASLGPMPDWLQYYCEALYAQQLFRQVPDQVIINEYIPGQGISAHLDAASVGEAVASLSLLSPCVMDFHHVKDTKKASVLLEPCSLVVLKDDARYAWTHGIAPRKIDHIHGQVIYRERRVSLTFRNVK